MKERLEVTESKLVSEQAELIKMKEHSDNIVHELELKVKIFKGVLWPVDYIGCKIALKSFENRSPFEF
ncbi:hypothetical protein ACH5RR_037108 [Cinchona calisaya]|uniref:Uncharacterized protein n=1 Tax=Cinchona calisaya TaxID=153742 RepID=A0ABD2Y8U5_9GENT